MTVAEHLRAKVLVDLAGCWIWQGAKNPAGYGAIKIDGRKQNTHRMAYEAFVGPVPRDRIVCHRCHNPACCNPDHLYAGTRAQNIADARQAGKSTLPRVTPAQAATSRRSRKPAAWPARRYGVNFSTVVKIRRGDFYQNSEAKAA